MATPLTLAIETLESTLKEAIDNSKILKTLDEQISNALGLLLDLVLLPFLPLLIGAIVTLYQEIIKFGVWWKDGWKKIEADGIAGLITLSLENSGKELDKWFQGILEWIFGDAPLSKKILDVFSGISDSFLDSNIPGLPLSWRDMFGVLFGSKFVEDLDVVLDFSFGSLGTVVESAVSYIFGGGASLINNSIEFTIGLAKGVSDLAWGVIEWLFEICDKSIDAVAGIKLDIFKGDSANPLWNLLEEGGKFVGGAVDFATSLFGLDVPKADTGGEVLGTGLAVIHKGEHITPANGGGLYVTINGTLFKDEEDMYRSVMDRVRADLWRQNV